MHTIVIVSENGQADDGLLKQLQMLFPDCRIKILQKEAEATDSISGKPGWSPKSRQGRQNN